MADLATLVDVKLWLGITGPADDAQLSRLITAVSASVVSYLGRSVVSDSYVETRNGHGRFTLALANLPIISVDAVTINDIDIPERPSTTDVGFTFDEQLLYLAGYCFTRGRQNVVVEYTAGYDTAPVDLTQAVIDIVGLKYRGKDRIGETMKVLGNQNISFVRDTPPDILRVLNQYRRTYAV